MLTTLWLAVPSLQPQQRVAEGQVGKATVCFITCADVLTIQSLQLACQHDFSGYPHTCKAQLLESGLAKVSYVSLPSLAGLLGVAPTAGVITRIERAGEVTLLKSASGHIWSALYGGWVFHAIYWPSVAIIARFWPHSWFGRRKMRAKRSEA